MLAAGSVLRQSVLYSHEFDEYDLAYSLFLPVVKFDYQVSI